MESNYDLIELRREGLYFSPGNFYIDPILPVETAIVTHAHADHFVNGHKTVYCTPSTSSLNSQRMKNYYGKKVSCDFHTSFTVNNITLEFIPAGHILGSAQVMVIYNNTKYLFTGDFKLTSDKSCEAFEFVQADVLITETTFASNGYQHPSDIEEIKKLNNYTGVNFVIGVYALGKAQRMISLINEFCDGKKIMVHRNISSFNRIYETSGFALGGWLPYDKHAFRKMRDMIYLLPPAHSRSFYPQPWYMRAFASGWDHLQIGYDFKLYISDHADWFDILKLVEQTGAKEVYTIHGDGAQLKSHLSEKGIKVTLLH
jgi:putative mRNA 3-end processing factor